MKKIAIDGYEANVSQRLGSSQVAFELIRNIEKIDRRNSYTIFLPSRPMDDLPGEREGFRYKIYRPGRFKTRLGIPLALFLSKDKPDVFFSPTHYIPQFTSVPRVVMIFDLAFFHFPELFTARDFLQMKEWTGYSIRNAEKIITISKASKKDIVSFYNIEPKKIAICYPGYDDQVFRPPPKDGDVSAVLKRYGISGSYIIFIGTIQPRKNLKRLIEAFVSIDGLKLVVVGKTTGPGRQAWMYQDILELPGKLGIKDKVVFTGFVPTADLPVLLGNAVAFALPSLWEGFGIPVLEAMACGTPVIVSEVSSLPEVVGDAGLLVNPESVTEIERAIRLVAADKKLRRKLSQAGLERAKQFSWEKMARDVIGVLVEVAE